MGHFGEQLDSFTEFDDHIYLLTKDARVYVLGKQLDYPLLGLGEKLVNITTPTEVVELRGQTIVQICSGEHHRMALNTKGQVFAWGRNNHGQLGVGDRVDHFRPVLVQLVGHNVSYLQCSKVSSFALTRTGQVLAWGGNTLGELGLGTYDDQVVPARVEFGEPVSRLASAHLLVTVAITANSSAFIWGIDGMSRPTPVELPKNVKSIVTNIFDYYVLTEDGLVFVSTKDDKTKVAPLKKQADIRFQTVFVDRNIDLIVGEDKDNYFYFRVGSQDFVNLTRAHSMAETFYNVAGAYLPFMVKLTNETLY